MANASFEAGYREGRAAANRKAGLIRLALTREGVSVVAGNSLNVFREKVTPGTEEAWFAPSENFGLGFWTAFMDRADELRET